MKKMITLILCTGLFAGVSFAQKGNHNRKSNYSNYSSSGWQHNHQNQIRDYANNHQQNYGDHNSYSQRDNRPHFMDRRDDHGYRSERGYAFHRREGDDRFRSEGYYRHDGHPYEHRWYHEEHEDRR